MDYFYNPYRKDFVKDCEKAMIFDEQERENIKDWGSITKFVLCEKDKSFKRALEKLNQIKSTRFDRKIQEGTNSKFFEALLKASKRNIAHKKEPKVKTVSQKQVMRQDNHMVQKIFNINFKNFQIPSRRGSTAVNMFSNLQSVLAPSETDLEAIKDEASFAPTTRNDILADFGIKEENEESNINPDLSEISENQLSKIPTNSKSKTSSSKSSSISDTQSVSCKFVINIKNDVEEEGKQDDDIKSINLSEKSKRLFYGEDDVLSDNNSDRNQDDLLANDFKINCIVSPPDSNGNKSSNQNSSSLTSYSSTSSKVTMNKSFLTNSGNPDL